jgi:P4 family phage/plasmid primase-like protien
MQINELKRELKAAQTRERRLTKRVEKLQKALETRDNTTTDNYIALAWLNDYRKNNEHLSYSPLGWRKYNPSLGVWEPPDKGKIRKALKDVFLRQGKLNVKTRDINSAFNLAADHNSRQGANDWDFNKNILTCESNALNLETFEQQPHSHELYSTTKLKADYNPEVLESELGKQWLDMMGAFFGDNQSFIQEFIGYSLTTDTAHDISIWLKSPGGGGKSTFLRAIASMIGGRCGNLNLSLLNKEGERSLGVVVGRTLLIAEEVGSRPTLERSDLLKLIIDGGEVSVKQLYRDPVSIKSNCKVLWGMNRIPTMIDQDGSISRRIQTVELLAIPPNKRDPQIRQNAESGVYNDAVLAWAVEGLKRLRERGRFEVPEAVSKNSLDLIESFDIEKQFITECCVHIPDFYITLGNGRGLGLLEQSKNLSTAYKAWCEGQGYRYPKSMGNLKQEWLRILGADRTIKKRNKIYYLDLKIINNPLPSDPYSGDIQSDRFYNYEVEFIKKYLRLSEGASVGIDYVNGLYEAFCNQQGFDISYSNLAQVLGLAGVGVDSGFYKNLDIK